MKRSLPLAKVSKALGAAGALAALGAVSTAAFAADHRDGSMAGVQAPTNIASDINDVYAFMNAGQVVLAMTVFPAADAAATFDDATVYRFVVNKHEAFGAVPVSAGTTNVYATFNTAGDIQMWIVDQTGTLDYVSGDPSAEAGLTSNGGTFKVFAGRRTDPFYFYLDGFNAARGAVFDALTAGLPLNGNGCPIIDATVGGVLRDALTTTVQTDDFFDTLNTLAIVVEADPDLFTDATNTLFTVYASTHVAN